MQQSLRLCSITISNLRSIRHGTFPLSDFTALIGYNNAGKTNILMGIRWLLHRSSLDNTFFDDQRKAVEVDGVFEGVSETVLGRLKEDDAAVLRKFVREGRLRVQRRQRVPGDAPENVEFRVWDYTAAVHGDWVRAPFGFEEAFRWVFPPAIQIWDFEGDRAFTKLMLEIFRPLERRVGSEFNELIKKFGDLLAPGSDTRAGELDAFDRNVNEKLNPLFPSVEVKLNLPVPTLELFLNNASLTVMDEDDGFERDIKNMGAGTKRAIQMALVRYLAETKRHHNNHYMSRTLFLIDSPELYLHPQAVELVRVALKNLSREGYQVVFATHSAQMVTSEDVSTSLLIRKNRERGTFMRKRMEDGMARASDFVRKNDRAVLRAHQVRAGSPGRRRQYAQEHAGACGDGYAGARNRGSGLRIQRRGHGRVHRPRRPGHSVLQTDFPRNGVSGKDTPRERCARK